MPALSNPTTWRKSHGVKGYLYIHTPAVIFAARTNVPEGQTYPTDQLYFDTVTVGAYSDVQPGMTVLIGSTAGAYDLGRQRIKSAQMTYFEIGWTSIGDHDGELIIPDNAYITVLDEHLVWTKTPFISIANGEQFKDRSTTFDAATSQPPVANGGVGYAGFVDPDTGVITVDFTSAASFATAPLRTIPTVHWEVKDGTITVGASGTEEITVEFPPGFRYVELTVDDSMSVLHTTYIPVFAAERTGDNAPFNVDAQLTFAPEGGKASFTLKENAPTTDYPDGTLVMFWVEDYYNGVLGSLAGQAGREHMRFIGFIHTEPTSIEAGEHNAEKKTTLECLDVAGKLATLPGFPQALRRVTSPTSWYEMTGANFDRFVHYLLHWHSTALELTDFYWSGTGDFYAFGSFSSDGATLYQQVDGRAQATGTGYRFTSDSQGILRLLPDPQYPETGDRTSTVIVALNEGDLQSYSYRKQRPPRVHWIRASAIKVTTNELTLQDILWAIAPGAAPGQGESAQEIGNRLCATQAQLNAFLGNYYARQNAPESQLDATLTHGGFAGIDPALMEWVTLTTSATNAPHRGLTFSSTRFLPLSVTLNFDSDKGTCEQSLTLEREVIGQAASVYVPPSANLPAYTPPETYFGEILDFEDTGFAGQTNFAIFDTNGHLYRTGAFNAPTWEDLDLGITGTATSFVVDAFSPKYLTGTGAVNGWVATGATDGARLYYIEDIFATTPTVTLLFTSAGVPYSDSAYVVTERETQNAVLMTWYDETLGASYAYTSDNSSFTEGVITSFLQGALNPLTFTPACYLVNGGLAWAGAFSASGSNDAAAGKVYRFDGATWTLSHGTLLTNPGLSMHLPFNNNGARNKMWYTRRQQSGGNFAFTIYYDGSTEYDRSPINGDGYSVAPTIGNKSLATNPTNGAQVLLCGTDHLGTPSSWKSIDAGMNWTEIDQSAFSALRGCDVDGSGNCYVWGDDGDIGFVANFGDVIEDRRANISDFTPGRIIGLCGG